MSRRASFALILACLGITSSSAIAIPRGLVVYAACPATFPARDGIVSKLVGASLYDYYISLQEPWHYPHGDWPDDIVTGNGPSALQCVYQHNREIVLELQKQVTGCWYDSNRKKQFTADCAGPKMPDPVPPPKIFVTRHLDAQSTLRGFGLARTVAEIEAAAMAQGTKAEITTTDNKQTAKIAFPDGQYVDVLFSPNGLSREIVWKTNGQTNFDDPVATAVQLFGFFTNIDDKYYRWDYHHGIVLLTDIAPSSHNGKIRLIDQRTADEPKP